MTFGARLQQAVETHGPLCVGLDPHPSLLDAWDLPDDAVGLRHFADIVLEALADRVAVLKPQSAFFERHGSSGVEVLEHVVGALAGTTTLSLLDVKRGDIGSTMQAYADAYLDPASPLAGDAITVSPYLGVGSLGPVLDGAEEHGRGVFVLALTSNPEGRQVQGARDEHGRSVAAAVLAEARRRNGGKSPMGSVGAVVGATIGSTSEDLDISGPLLAPGVGAQGAGVAELGRVFAGVTDRVLPASSRGVLGAGPDVTALRERAGEVAATCRAGLDQG
ncbi:MAG TPA: orotidine-5'-phosphate decarboxylase [Jiangellaceae bacterium]|nr:orotidine-5'-phosphate decarboxylase [Jiangellaceae bacterium]